MSAVPAVVREEFKRRASSAGQHPHPALKSGSGPRAVLCCESVMCCLLLRVNEPGTAELRQDGQQARTTTTHPAHTHTHTHTQKPNPLFFPSLPPPLRSEAWLVAGHDGTRMHGCGLAAQLRPQGQRLRLAAWIGRSSCGTRSPMREGTDSHGQPHHSCRPGLA